MPEGTLDLVVEDEKTWSDLVRDLLNGEDTVPDLTACSNCEGGCIEVDPGSGGGEGGSAGCGGC